MRRPPIPMLLLAGMLAWFGEAAAPTDRKEAAGQAVTPGTVVDHDYRFRLSLPEATWQVLGEAEARKASPDALAFAVARGSAYRGACGAVIVEASPGLAVEPLAQLILGTMPLEEKELLRFEHVTFQGTAAIRLEVKGTAGGQELRFSNTVFLSRDHAYQVVAWGPAAVVSDGAAFRALRRGFSLLEGEVRGRSSTPTVRDAWGPDWRITNGCFSSAAYGFAVDPRGGWRLVAGRRLEEMNPDAEIGLRLERPDAWVCFVAEHVAGVDAPAFAASLTAQFGRRLGPAEDRGGIVFSIAGRPLEFKRVRTRGPPAMEFIYGVHVRGDLFVQIIAWYVAQNGRAALQAMPEGLAAFAHLDEAAVRKLTDQLRTRPDMQNVVGPAFSVRGGVYRNFERRVVWRRPVEGTWRIHAGLQARLIADDAELVIEEPRLGFVGVLVCEPILDMKPEEYHAAVLTATIEKENEAHRARPERMTMDGTACRATWAEQPLNGELFRYRIITARHGDFAVQFVLSGYKGNMEAAQDSVDRAVHALSFAGDSLQAVRCDETAYTDLRLGFCLKLTGEKRTLNDTTPAALDPIGAKLTGSAGERSFALVSFNLPREEQEERYPLDLVRQLLKDTFPFVAAAEPETGEPATLGGLPCRHLAWKAVPAADGGSSVPRSDLYLLRRDRMIYAFIETGGSQAGEDLTKLFELVP